MSPKTFGYTDGVDVDLREIQNEKWLVTLRSGFPLTENCVSFEVVRAAFALSHSMEFHSANFQSNTDSKIYSRFYRDCVIFVRNHDKSRVDTFRMVDIAEAASRITDQCVIEKKYPIGGISSVGSMDGNFYVGVGGLTLKGLASAA